MKKLIILAALLAGCATPPPRPTPAQLEFQAYVETWRPVALRGDMKWTAYYHELKRLARNAGAPPMVQVMHNDLIALAEEYEAGKMDYAAFRRQVDVMFDRYSATVAEHNRQNQLVQSQADTQQREAWSRLGQSLMAAGAPQPVAPQQRQGSPLQRQNLLQFGRQCIYANGIVVTMQGNNFCPDWNYN